MTQAFKVKIAAAPVKHAAWTLPVGWVTLADEDGNEAIGAVMADGVIHGDFLTGSMGVCIGYSDCAETCRAALELFAAPAVQAGYTAKTVTKTDRRIFGRKLADKVFHQVIRADGDVLTCCASIELAEKIAKELNAFEANPPKFGDLEAEFQRIAGQTK